MIRKETGEDLFCALSEQITAHVDAILIGVEPFRISLLHLRMLHSALAFLVEVGILFHLKQLSRAREGAWNG